MLPVRLRFMDTTLDYLSIVSCVVKSYCEELAMKKNFTLGISSSSGQYAVN